MASNRERMEIEGDGNDEGQLQAGSGGGGSTGQQAGGGGDHTSGKFIIKSVSIYNLCKDKIKNIL